MTVPLIHHIGGSDQSAVRQQLERIIESRPFAQSARRKRFLEFIVNETLAGRADRLKGYSIALEVFDRPETFDPVSDPVVRIEAARVRAKLREYYETDGRDDALHIVLPKGSYVPHVEFRKAVVPDPAPEATTGPSRNGRRHAALTESPFDGRLSIAVLPFVNMSAHSGNTYLTDGLADTLITELAKISGLRVVSRQSSFAHRDAGQRLHEIASALSVRYLIEGSVHVENERMRISASLIDTASDFSLWAERYERSTHDLFAVQDEVCRSVVRALRVNLTPLEADRVGQLGTCSRDAHLEVLRGLERYWLYTREACAEAQQHFSQAIALDDEYATAHAWFARTHVFQASVNWAADAKWAIVTAIRHAQRAVEIDDRLPLAHSILGWALLEQKDGETAITEGRRACALDPTSAEAKLYLACILAATGHGEEGLHNIETAMLLQPHPSACYFDVLGCCHFALGDYERAMAAFRRGIEINPCFITCHYQLAVTYGVCGHADNARAEAAIVRADWPNVSVDFFLEPGLKSIWLRGMNVAGLG
jgi:TolB-like protein/Tfp pilus assembly protein PilF